MSTPRIAITSPAGPDTGIGGELTPGGGVQVPSYVFDVSFRRLSKATLR